MGEKQAMDKNVLVLSNAQVKGVLTGREKDVIEIVRRAYLLHHQGQSSLPHSVFLRFPGNDTDRIIGLPAYLGGEYGVAGMKWVSSFPGNIRRGVERASAAIFLNEMQTGRVRAILEGSVISAQRTAASAALAGKCMHADPGETVAGLIGCGVINGQILRFLRTEFPRLAKVYLYDLSDRRMDEFIARNPYEGLAYEKCGCLADVFHAARLVAFATTAGTPYVHDASLFTPEHTVLGISLRDIAPEIIEAGYNIVDDLEHVNREGTSIHLACQRTGGADFVAGNIADAADGAIPSRAPGKASIYSPFGLGVLDVALADYVYARALENGVGTVIEDFQP